MRESFVSSRTLSTGLCAPLLAVVFAGCEPDDPAVRHELAELRTALADTRRELDTVRASLASAEQKAARVDFEEAADLSASLKTRTNELRTIVIQACPGTRIESFSIGAVETPLNSPHPYRANFNFALRQIDPGSGQAVGDNLGPYTVTIQADRDGDWQLPTAADLAALFDNPAASAADAAPPDDGSRHVEWGDSPRNQRNATQRPSAPAPRQPAANPMPSQETREIRFE